MAEEAAAILGARLDQGLVVTGAAQGPRAGRLQRARGRPSPPRCPRPARRPGGGTARWAAWRLPTCSCSSSPAAPRPCCPRRSWASPCATRRAPPRSCSRRGRHPRAEHRTQAPLAPQGRRPRAAGGSGPGAGARALGRGGRRPLHHRLRTRLPRPHDLRRRPQDSRAAWHPRPGARLGPRPPRAGLRGLRPETPKPGDRLFRRVKAHVVGSNRSSLEAMAREGRRLGFRPLILTSRLAGEARDVAAVLVAVLRECVETGRPMAPPCCLLAGGETTVTVRGTGFGGRNQEMAVAAVEPLADFPHRGPLREPGHGRCGRPERCRGWGGGPAGRGTRPGAGPGPSRGVPGQKRQPQLPGSGGLPHRHRPHRNQRHGSHGPAARYEAYPDPLDDLQPRPYNDESPDPASGGFPRGAGTVVGRPLLHDEDPAEGPESPEQDPLAALIQPPERGRSGDPAAAEAFQQRAQLAEDRLTEVLNAYRRSRPRTRPTRSASPATSSAASTNAVSGCSSSSSRSSTTSTAHSRPQSRPTPAPR